MPYATTPDGVRLYYEEVGSGTPILFLHEFAGDHRAWEPQMRYFSRRHRCIAYSARGYHPSDIPASRDVYSYTHFADDVVTMLDHLGIAKAHIAGLSMGGYTAMQIGMRNPDRALSLTLAGTGSGADLASQAAFRKAARETADQFEKLGSAQLVKTYGHGPSRIPFEVKDPRGFAEFLQQFGEHDARGAANTMRGFQGARPSVYEFEDALRRITVPTLIIVGDEDDACLGPSLFFKKNIVTSGLVVFPKTGHVVHLEEPERFNRALDEFVTRVEAGRWPARDPRALPTKS